MERVRAHSSLRALSEGKDCDRGWLTGKKTPAYIWTATEVYQTTPCPQGDEGRPGREVMDALGRAEGCPSVTRCS